MQSAARTLSAARPGGTFGALFAGLQNSASSSSSAVTVTVDGELVHSVKELLDRGTSLGDVIAQLANSLAASVAAQLGISPQSARERLTQAFTGALQPGGNGPPQTNAERASSLVSRLRQIAELATGVTNGDTGQPIRLIAGQRSDAEQAKATPAPTPDTMLRDAQAALAGPASPATGATTTIAARDANASPSDGRTVALYPSAQAIAAGGDTPLGRILTRALGERHATPVASDTSGAVVAPKADGQLTGLTPALRPAQDDAISAFLSAFTRAVAREDGASHRDAGIATASVSTDSAATPISYAIPLVKDVAPVVPAPPAPPLPQPQHVDANAVVDQVLRGVAIRTTDGQSEVRLRLVPEQLGDVSIKLVVAGGAVDASITTHTADAQSALAAAQSQLAKTFADAGLKLQSFTVALAGGGFGDARDQSRHNGAPARANSRRIAGVGALADEPNDASLLAMPSFGPPIYAARSLLGNLNYLV